jgi:integrase
MNEFSENLSQKLQEKGLSESSIKLYIRNLEKLNEGELKNLKFLSKKDSILEKLNKYKDNTKRGFLISIVSVLGCCPEDKKLVKIKNEYYSLMVDKSKEIKNKETTELTEEQKKNWISWDEIKETFKKLEEEINKFKDNKVISDKDYSLLLGYAILACYIYNSPRRNKDYQNMNIVKYNNDGLPKDINYYLYDDNKFIFNKYKTEKTYGKQEIPVSDDLKKVLDIYIKFHPHLKGKVKKNKLVKSVNTPLFVYQDGTELSSINSITRILNKILGNKKMGSSALRHIFLSDKYKDVNNDMKKDAELMAHSTPQQQQYIKEI